MNFFYNFKKLEKKWRKKKIFISKKINIKNDKNLNFNLKLNGL